MRQPELVESKMATLDPDGEMMKHFLAVQQPFFSFAAELEQQALAVRG